MLVQGQWSLYTISMSKERLVVIDGHALIHRAYHAIPPLTTQKGELVNAVYGFTTILLNVIRELHPEYLVVAFDLPGKTVRHEEYGAYKANRVKAPDELVSQFERVKDVVRAFDMPIFEFEGYEADDVIGTISKNAPKNVETFIVTGDMDELQLVDDKTKVYTMRRGFTDTVIYDELAIKEKYGLTPDEFIDYKALKGDPSDNIPGVSGIGEKTATELIKSYGSLDGVYENLDKLKPRVAEKLEEEKEIAYLSQKLSTIKTDLPIKVDFDKCQVHRYDRQRVYELFQELEFRSLLSKIPENKTSDESPVNIKESVEGSYKVIESEKEILELVKKALAAKQVSIFIDTAKGKDQSETKGIGVALKAEEAFYVPYSSDSFEILSPLFENDKVAKIGHNLKGTYINLSKLGHRLAGIHFDTMIAAYLLNPNTKNESLEDLSIMELGVTIDEDTKNKAAKSADAILRIYQSQLSKMEQSDLFGLLQKIEIPLVTILAEMEMAGITLDVSTLKKIDNEVAGKIAKLNDNIKREAGEEFNVASPSQLQTVLYNKLKIHEKLDNPNELKKLKTGGYSTAASELEKLRAVHPIVEHLFEFRELTKLKNTYLDVLPRLVDKSDGRIHTSFNQTVAQTGRLSSSDPNLQNIPIKTEMGQKIRKAFVAAPGYVLLSADYSQIELRVIAHIAKDEVLTDIFKEGRDIHTETAAKVYGVNADKVTPKMRRIAKIINFGIIYGVSAHGLRQQTGASYEEGKKLIEKYFTLHPKIKEYSDRMIGQAKELGYVETIFGRRRYLPEINSTNFVLRGSAERMAINMPVQGTAADLMKLAMIDIAAELPTVSPKAKLLLQVHDELVFEVPEKDAEKVAKFVQAKMNGVVSLSVPIETSVGWGLNWGLAK